MKSNCFRANSRHRSPAFTLIEMLVVIAIMSILMTAGAIGLGGMGGKGVSSGVATAESLFAEARALAVGRNLRACVLIAKDLDNNKSENLRRVLVAYENTDGSTGAAKDPGSNTPDWVISSRGAVLPDQTFFSETFSKKNHETSSGTIDTITASKLKSSPSASSSAAAVAVKAASSGTYYIYEFNSQGIAKEQGASFVIGSGSRVLKSGTDKPRVTASGKRDFGGFVVWRNGQTSVFRSPEQIASAISSLTPGKQF